MTQQKQALPIFHPYSTYYKWPSKGKLKWIGGNLGLDYPVCEEVLDSNGNLHYMGLAELLQRLDEFEGFRCDMPIKEWHIEMCLTAYEYKQLSSDEREIFEAYVRERIGAMPSLEMAKRLMLNS